MKMKWQYRLQKKDTNRPRCRHRDKYRKYSVSR